MWRCMKWRDVMHGCMVYTERADMAAVLSGTSHVRTKQRCNYTTWEHNYSKLAVKSYSHSFRVTHNKSSASLLESGEQRYVKAICKSDQEQLCAVLEFVRTWRNWSRRSIDVLQTNGKHLVKDKGHKVRLCYDVLQPDRQHFAKDKDKIINYYDVLQRDRKHFAKEEQGQQAKTSYDIARFNRK